jgi:hypothetical protein
MENESAEGQRFILERERERDQFTAHIPQKRKVIVADNLS